MKGWLGAMCVVIVACDHSSRCSFHARSRPTFQVREVTFADLVSAESPQRVADGTWVRVRAVVRQGFEINALFDPEVVACGSCRKSGCALCDKPKLAIGFSHTKEVDAAGDLVLREDPATFTQARAVACDGCLVEIVGKFQRFQGDNSVGFVEEVVDVDVIAEP